MKYKMDKKARRLVKVLSVLKWNDFRYPQPVKGTYDVAVNKSEKVKWAYRCWINQLERAEKGSGIEEFFRKQDLSFSIPEGFEVKESMSLSAGGDLMAVDCLTYENTTYLFDDIKDFYFDADITVANLESTVYEEAPLGRNQVPGMPAKMNTSIKMLERFLDGGKGINYFSTANNHCYDYEEAGLYTTMDTLDKYDCYYSGTNRTPEEQEDVLIIEKNGIKIAMLAYTFDMNGNHYEKKYLINEVRFNDEVCDISLVKRHIARAKEKGADIIIANCHWGWEFEMYPHKNVIDVAHQLIEEGVDIILGGHPHVAQSMEKYEYDTTEGKKAGFITYSLGDFVSFHPHTKNSKITYVLKMNINKGLLNGKESVCISDLKVLPVYIQCAELTEGGKDYDCRLLKFYNVVENINGYKLDDMEKKDIPRLEKKVLYGILLPQKYENVLVKK